MTEKELKRLTRRELLEMLIEQSKENYRLKSAFENTEAMLNDRTVKIERSGTLAEASLVLNGVFDAADKAAEQYLQNVKQYCEEKQSEADRILAEARKQAEEIVTEAQEQRADKIREVNAYVSGVNERLREFYTAHPETRALLIETGGIPNE